MHLLRHIFAPVRASGLKMLWSIIGVGVEILAANYHFSIRALALAKVGGHGSHFIPVLVLASRCSCCYAEYGFTRFSVRFWRAAEAVFRPRSCRWYTCFNGWPDALQREYTIGPKPVKIPPLAAAKHYWSTNYLAAEIEIRLKLIHF